MKKTRKVLSLVLAVLFAFSSMPVVYVGTGAADAVTYALDETGTLENPTRPVEASGSFPHHDLVKLTVEIFNTDYTFYQTKNEEHFALTQSYYLQKVNASGLTLSFENVGLFEKKTSDMTNPDSANLEWRGNEDDGLWEVPGIKDNRTDKFIANHLVSEEWEATTSASQAITTFPFEMPEDSRYAWNYNIIFKGNSAEQVGEHNINYYQQLKWRWDSNKDSDFAKVDLRLQTRIRILDAREFEKELTRLENIVANPEEYTQAYVSSAQAILNDIPATLKNYTEVYDQSVIDKHTEIMKNLSFNAADYTKYNELYTALSSITNTKGAYTDDSYATFKDEIQKINTSLSKSLDKTQQSVVDAATKALQDAFAKLVATDLSDDDTSSGWTSRDKGYGYIDARIDRTSFKFMQVSDYQKFQFDQSFYIRRYGGYSASYFHGLYFEENYPTCGSSICAGDVNLTNGTTEFLNRMDQSQLATVTAKNENGTSITAKEYNKWIWDGSVDNAGNSIVENGLLKHDHKIAKDDVFSGGEYLAYAADSSPVFYGRPANDYGEIDLTYVYRLGYEHDLSESVFPNKKKYHWHIPTTIEVTDVRQLISVVEEAENKIENADDYSDEYITSLKAATTGIPIEMTRGVEYYTQEEVDALYNQINNVLTAGEEGAKAYADYAEYTELLEKLMAVENQSRYTEESFEKFEDKVYEINKNLPKNLPASEQAQVDAAVAALRAAYAELEFYEVGDDNSFNSSDLPDNMGFSPLDFKVSNTEYTFMQTYDGQKFALETELYLESTNDNYDAYICGLQYSMVKSGDTTCADRGEAADTGCHNLENIIVPKPEDDPDFKFTDSFLDIVSEGVEKAAKDAKGKYIPASDGTGTIGQNTTWVFDAARSVGSSFISDGKIKYESVISTAPHYATSEVLCVGFDGGASGDAEGFEAMYSWRLGWGYRERHILDNLVNLSSTTYRHVHIPVKVKLTDARALNSLYEQACNILKGKGDVSYTLETLINLNEACKSTPQDMVYGETYYTQDAVNTEYAKLKAAFDQLESGADYSDYFDVYTKAEEIINSGNKDDRGNQLYDEEAYNKFVENVTNIDNALRKDLENTKENQDTVNAATQGIVDALTTLEETKKADYSKLNDAMAEAEEILNAPEGTYTDKTIEAVQKAYDDAKNLPKNLSAADQAQIDAARDALKEANAKKEFKADYSEYNEAYDKVQYIIDNPGKYTEETIKAAEQVMGTAGAINKDLADTAANRVIIKNATDELNNMLKNAVETADYTKFNEAYKQVEEIANDTTGNYTDETIQAAKDALSEADTLPKDLPNNHQNQAQVDEATGKLVDMLEDAQIRADYSGFDEAYQEIEDILNNPDSYTSETVENAQAAKNAADELGKNQPAENQDAVNKVIQDLIDAKTNAQEKADYSGFDEAYQEIEDILNNPDSYTSETVKNAQAAKDAADELGKDQPAENQDAVDKVIQDLVDAKTNAKDKADYTDYNELKEKLDAIIEAGNVNENGEPIFDEDAFKDFVEAFEKIEEGLDKDLSSEYQDEVDSATKALEELEDVLEENRIATSTVIDPETTTDSLKDKVIEEGGYNPDEVIVEFKNYLGEELAGADFVGTGSTMRVILKSTGELLEFKLFIVMGDVDGDGDVDADDYSIAKLVGVGMHSYAEENKYFFTANDMDADGYIDVIDTALLRRMY